MPISEDDHWERPPANLVLASNQVHIWRVRLDGVENEDELLWKMLSPGERDRAGRFRFDQLRFRFLRSHGILRAVLSRYTGIPADILPIETAVGGKPYLGVQAGSGLRFNLSHSGDWMVVGIAALHELGVDIEINAREVEWKLIAQDYFHPREIEAIAGLAEPIQQLKAFFRVWTLKEAYLKAVGSGLAGGLEQVEVKVADGGPAIFINLPGEEIEKRRWQVFSFQPGSGAFGSAVVERLDQDIQLIRYHWRGLASGIT